MERNAVEKQRSRNEKVLRYVGRPKVHGAFCKPSRNFVFLSCICFTFTCSRSILSVFSFMDTAFPHAIKSTTNKEIWKMCIEDIPDADDNCIRLCWWTMRATTPTSAPPSPSTSRAGCPQRCSPHLIIRHQNVYTHDQHSQNCFERLSPPSPFASPPGRVGSNAEPAWTDPSPVSWSSCSDWLLHRFSRLALRSHQGMA